MRRSLLSIVLLALLLGLVLPVAASSVAKPDTPSAALTSKAPFFTSDGMRPDLLVSYAAQGAMPAYASLLRQGVEGNNGLLQGFPPNTGVGWYTLATGTWPGEHGSTNNTFHRIGEGNFNNRT